MSDTAVRQETEAQKHGLTIAPATALVTGTIIGSGIFTLPAALAAYGPISLVGFAITAFGAMMLALVFSSLARRSPDVGGPYAFARKGFGDFVGFESAWTYWIGAWAGVAAISVSMVGYLGALIPAVSENRLLGVLCALGAIALLTAVNVRGVVTGGVVSLVLTILKIVPLFGIGTIGFIAFNSDNLGPFNGSGLPPFEVITIVMALTLFSFIGIEAATIPAGDVHEPEKTIPRATTFGTLAAAAVYLLSTAAVFGAVPNQDLQESEAPFALAAVEMFGSWAGNAISLVAVVSCLGAMNGLILLAGQVPMAAEMDGLAPKAFGKLNKNHAPVFGLVVSGGIAMVFTAMNFTGGDLVKVYTQLLLVSTVTTLVPYAFSAAAEMKWLMLDKGKIPVMHFSRQLAVAAMAMMYAIFAFYGAGADQVYWGFMLILFGIPLYLFVLRRRQGEGLKAGGRVTNENYPAPPPSPDS
jgi:APA family basic amino acid/polyamine antiporter